MERYRKKGQEGSKSSKWKKLAQQIKSEMSFVSQKGYLEIPLFVYL